TVAALLRGLPNDVFFKVGLITIIGLSAKNAILIVEFAVTLQREGRTLHQAVLEAARLRFRPILMTSFAFILGVFPMAISTGAGANARHAIGTGVVGGMLSALVLGVLWIPVCYVAVRRIIVAISVDEFSADLFTEYRPLFKAGLQRLQTGVVFPAGYQSHAATETCPGHSTILTGSRPARTGIIANEWYDQSLGRADKKVYCSEDPSLPGSSSTNFTVSAQFLKAQ